MAWSKAFIVRWKFNLFKMLQILRDHSPVHDGEYPEGFNIGDKYYAYEKVRKWKTLRNSWRLGKRRGGISVNEKGDGLTIRNTSDGVAWIQDKGAIVNDFMMPAMPNVYGHPVMMVSPGFFTTSRKGFEIKKHKGFVRDAVMEFFFHSKGLKVSWGKHANAPLASE